MRAKIVLLPAGARLAASAAFGSGKVVRGGGLTEFEKCDQNRKRSSECGVGNGGRLSVVRWCMFAIGLRGRIGRAGRCAPPLAASATERKARNGRWASVFGKSMAKHEFFEIDCVGSGRTDKRIGQKNGGQKNERQTRFSSPHFHPRLFHSCNSCDSWLSSSQLFGWPRSPVCCQSFFVLARRDEIA